MKKKDGQEERKTKELRKINVRDDEFIKNFMTLAYEHNFDYTQRRFIPDELRLNRVSIEVTDDRLGWKYKAVLVKGNPAYTELYIWADEIENWLAVETESEGNTK